MANKLKAEEIALKNSKEYLVSKNNSHQQNILFKEKSIVECEKCAMEMAEWKEQQMIEYLYKNIQSLLKDYGVSEASADIATQLFLANFKQAMKKD